MRKTESNSSAQQGAATIFVTIVLLLAVGLIALYTNRGAIMEQRLTANEIRAKQAFAAANAGIEAALARWHTDGISLVIPPVVPPAPASVYTPGTATLVGTPNTYYRYRYCDSAAAPPVCPPKSDGAMVCTVPPLPTQIRVVSCGWSDDNTSVQRVSQIVGPSESTGGNVSTPLIAKGTADLLTGGATVMNYFNDLTVWTGLSLMGKSNTAKTMVRDAGALNLDGTQKFPSVSPDAAPAQAPWYRPATANECNNVEGYECSSQGSSLGHDTVTGDTNLSTKSKDEFFFYLYGKSATSYRETTATYTVDLYGKMTREDATTVGGIVDMKGEVIWIEGNATDATLAPARLPNGNGVIGLPGVPGKPEIPGPVVIIVHGDLDLTGFNGTINGVVYVHGNLTGGGSPTIFGALIVAGNANATGNIRVIYDPVAVSSTNRIGKAAKLPGTWRDW